MVSGLIEPARNDPAEELRSLTDSVRVALSLNQVAVSSEEFASLEPGDTLLLGASSLDRLPSVRLVSWGGWVLADGRIVSASDSTVSVALCNWRVEAPRTPAGGVELSLEVGDASLQTARRGLPSDLDLAVGPADPVWVRSAGGLRAAGELVRVGDEAGVRLLAPFESNGVEPGASA